MDISPAMISKAEKNCRQVGAQAVTFCQTANEIAPNSVDLVTSIIVLQHIRVKQGLKIIEDLLDTLVVGGVATLDITAYRKFPMKYEIVYRIKHGIPGAWVLLNLIHGKRLSEPPMERNEYPLDTVLEIYHRNQRVRRIAMRRDQWRKLLSHDLSRRRRHQFSMNLNRP